MPESNTLPTIIIVGAGLGGLLLGTLLEKINVPYHIFERAAVIRPLGAVMTLGANILPVFEQLGLLDEIVKMSLYCPSIEIYNDQRTRLGNINLSGHEAVSGYGNLMFARPRLYQLLLNQVPAHKINLGKKVLRTEEKDEKVIIHCADGTSFIGDILVGADGAYSGVRQSLFKRISEKGLLPKEDLENLTLGFVSMVGVAECHDLAKYPIMKDDFCHFYKVLAKDGKGCSVVSIPDGKIGWLLSVQLSEEDAKTQQFRNSEWGPESNESMLNEFADINLPWGGVGGGTTLGDLFALTPKHLISKVFLEEKLFTTWYHGRTVLLGDACHKMLPAAGQGAVNAMQDAVVLANCIYNMGKPTSENITAAFKDYYSQRFERSNDQIKRSGTMSTIMSGQTIKQKVTRHVFLNYLPEWVQQRSFEKTFEYRPQIAWMPLTKNRGTGRVLPQECKRFDGKEE
ncbi:hypothetical protein BGZ76_002017 [Entomortierella beljakovae]|nr:hypothetical protein BGZ76_002017 [Entomortierella beljakovae]